MKNIINNQKGAILVIFALSLIVLIGFAALGTEVGRWYLTRVELSKAVDAAALAGAANISNPTIDVVTLAQDFGMENFQPGYLGTPGTGDPDHSVSFAAATQAGGKLTVTGRTNSVAILARIFGIEYVATAATGVAQKNKVEIMLVLDRSGSMCGSRSTPCSGNNDGTPFEDLKDAARSFIDYYKDTQDEDMIGLVSFATGVSLDSQLDHGFYDPMIKKIDTMKGIGATNAEDAIAQAGAAFVDQTPVAPANRIQQYIIFFTDGRPTAFRGKFKNNDTDNIDAVVCGTGNDCDTVYTSLGKPDKEEWIPNIDPRFTGDGKIMGTSKCTASPLLTTKWYVFKDYPMPGYPNLEQCLIPTITRNGRSPNYTYSVTSPLSTYICTTARQMAIAHASELKTKFVKIYAIGLGDHSTIDEEFLGKVAITANGSSSDYVYITPDSTELESIFRKIAKDIKLRLVQ